MKERDLADLLLLAAIWGSSFLFMRVAAPQFGPVPLIALRVAIGALFLIPLVLWRGRPSLSWKKAGHIAFVGIFNSAIPFSLFAYATLSVTGGFAAILNAATPLFGALIARLWLRDRLSWARIVGLVIGFLGVVLLVWGKASFKHGGNGLAVLAGLSAALCYGISTTYTKKRLSEVEPMVIAGGSQVAAFLFLAIPAWFLFPRGPIAPAAWEAALALGVFCTGVAYILFYRLIKNAGPARAMSVTFLMPVFTMVFGFLFLKEAVTLRMTLACALILLGTACATGLLAPRRRAA